MRGPFYTDNEATRAREKLHLIGRARKDPDLQAQEDVARQNVALPQYAPFSEAEEDVDGDVEFVITSLHPSIHSGALALTVRGMRDERACSLIAAWCWVFLSTACVIFFSWASWLYVAHNLADNPLVRKSHVKEAVRRLIQVMEMNSTLSGSNHSSETGLDSSIQEFCEKTPSPYFFSVLEFMFCAFLVGHISDARTLAIQIWKCPVVETREETAEERADSLMITGLIKTDAYWLIAGLALPKIALAGVFWYIGSAFMAYTKTMTSMASRVVLLVFMSQVDSLFFRSFYSSSKQDWVGKAQIVQQRGRCLRYSIAWPGECAKLVFVLVVVGVSFYLYKDTFNLRWQCWHCVRDCLNNCSNTFHFCHMLEAPFLHNIV